MLMYVSLRINPSLNARRACIDRSGNVALNASSQSDFAQSIRAGYLYLGRRKTLLFLSGVFLGDGIGIKFDTALINKAVKFRCPITCVTDIVARLINYCWQNTSASWLISMVQHMNVLILFLLYFFYWCIIFRMNRKNRSSKDWISLHIVTFDSRVLGRQINVLVNT